MASAALYRNLKRNRATIPVMPARVPSERSQSTWLVFAVMGPRAPHDGAKGTATLEQSTIIQSASVREAVVAFLSPDCRMLDREPPFQDSVVFRSFQTLRVMAGPPRSAKSIVAPPSRSSPWLARR